MNLNWKHIYPWIKAAVIELDSVDSLLRQTVGLIATTYDADCLLIAGLETDNVNSAKAFATLGALKHLGYSLDDPTLEKYPDSIIRQFHPHTIPRWLLDQQKSPHLVQLKAGELIIPVVHATQNGHSSSTSPSSTAGVPTPSALQMIVLLKRSGHPSLESPSSTSVPLSSAGLQTQVNTEPSTTIMQGWSADEVDSLEVVCNQLGLAYSALYWRQRLEQSRQQAALVGRIARLLNSSLNPDEIVGRIVAELGQGLQCDRCILVDLRPAPVNILAIWDHPDRELVPLPKGQINQELWQDVVEMFLQGGASYLQVDQTGGDADSLQGWLEDIGADSVLLIPLFIQSEFFGAVALLSYQKGRQYQVDELQTIRQVADQAAIALTNAQNYQSLWHRQEALRIQNKSLQQEVIRDELTHLLNRRSLERELEQLSSKAVWAVTSVFSVIVCDLDYFKLINDTYGHLIGDEVLQVLAKRLQNQLRRNTPVYRYGGEEFVIILTNTELSTAIDVAERLRYAIRSSPVETKEGKIQVTASFGVAQEDPESDRHAWDVIHRADQALYDAKRQGRDRIKAL